MSKGWIGMLGAAALLAAGGLGFVAGQGSRPQPQPMEDPSQHLSIEEGAETTEFSRIPAEVGDDASPSERGFILALGQDPKDWRQIPQSPETLSIPNQVLEKGSAVLSYFEVPRARPCICTDLEPPIDLFGTIKSLRDQTDPCDRCDETLRERCADSEGDPGTSPVDCTFCRNSCWTD